MGEGRRDSAVVISMLPFELEMEFLLGWWMVGVCQIPNAGAVR